MTAASEVSGRSDWMASMRRSMTCGATDVVGVEEVDEGLAPSALGVGQGRPALEEVDEDLGLLVAKPVEDLREIGLEREREAVGEPHAVLDEVAARLDEAAQRAHVWALVPQRRELLAVANEELEGDRGVGRVVLGAARGEGAAVLRERAGVDGEDDEDVVLEQRRDDRAVGELEADGDAAAGEALAELAGPRRRWPRGGARGPSARRRRRPGPAGRRRACGRPSRCR